MDKRKYGGMSGQAVPEVMQPAPALRLSKFRPIRECVHEVFRWLR